MLYKVTPAMEPPAEAKKSARTPGQARPRRKTAIFDSEGQEVLITLMCLKCKKVKPLVQFGLRKMADGAIRNQPWCRPCRSAASSKKGKEVPPVTAAPSLSNGAPLESATAEVLLELAHAENLPETAEVTIEDDTGDLPVTAEPVAPQG